MSQVELYTVPGVGILIIASGALHRAVRSDRRLVPFYLLLLFAWGSAAAILLSGNTG